jgi:hypothetical protein
MNVVLGSAVIAVGVLAIGIGGRSALTAQRPSWLSERTIPAGREKAWGLAIALLGFGMSGIGAFWLSDLFGGPGILGVLLLFVGVGFLVIGVGPNSIRK